MGKGGKRLHEMGISTTTPSSQQSPLILATAAAIAGVLAGVLLAVGYGEVVVAMTGSRKSPSTGTAGAEVDGRARDDNRGIKGGREMEKQRKREAGLGGGEGEGGRGGVEANTLVRDVKEGIEGCIGNTPLIRIVS